MSKLNSNHGFISLLYSIGENPLGLWSKYVSSEGHVRRIEDEGLNGDKVIEIRGPEDSLINTNISCPANPLDRLNIQLPVLVVILKNLKARIRIDLQLIDNEDIRRKFVLSNHEITEKGGIVVHETARIFLNLEDDWNNLEIDLRTLCQTIYHTEYRALQRLIIYQNCRLRRIYLQDRHYDNDETPIQLCQAFFDMYMLKWGINFVEKSCQTNLTYNNVNDEETVSSKETEISRVQHNVKSFSTEKLSKLRKISASKVKESTRESSIKSSKLQKRTKNEAETTRRKKMSTDRKAPSLGKIASTSGRMKKISRNDDDNVGEIFRKWPYNYLQYQQIGQTITTKLKPIVPTNVSNLKNLTNFETKFNNIVDSSNRQFPKENETKNLLIEFPVPMDIEREATAEIEKIVKTTRSKILTTDEALHNYLELRHVLNPMIFENFRSHGLTMTEVELSICNMKNRQNSYGQGKLVEKQRMRNERACNATSEETTREKSAIDL